MKNPFSYVKGLILKYTQETPELKQTKSKHRGLVTRIMERIRPGKAIVAEQLQETPAQYARSKEIRHRAMMNAEQEATNRALDMIRYAMENPDDNTAQLAKNKAIEYLNRNKELQGKGDLQDWNRQQIAERWIQSDLSSVEGQAARKEKQLDQFNKNMGTTLNQDTWKTTESIINTPAFQKQLELLGGQYKLLYETVGDAVEKNVDPVRIEKTLDLYTAVGADDYELFSEIMSMDADYFKMFDAEARAKLTGRSERETYENNSDLWGLFDQIMNKQQQDVHEYFQNID